MTEDFLLVLLALFLVLLNGFFVAAEFAIVKVRATQVEQIRKLKGWRGDILSRVHRQLDAYLSACQLGITLSSLGLGWIGEPAFAQLLEVPLRHLGIQDPETVHTVAFIVAFATISYLHIVIGELAPKSWAIRRPESVSLWTATPLFLFYWAMYPAIYLLNKSANAMLRKAGLGEPGHEHDLHYSPQELKSILHFSRALPEGPDTEMNTLLAHTLELRELQAADLMRRYADMVSISTDDSAADIRRLVQRHRYSRYPLLDAENQTVLGMLHIKDLLLEAPADLPQRLRTIARPLEWIHEDTPVLETLRHFRQGAPHFAIIRDHDGPVGFLTLEDILEAVFGEITDEHEQSREGTRRSIYWLKDGSLLVRGDTPVFQLERALGRSIAGSEDVSTAAGLVLARLDHVPKLGDRAEFEGFSMQVRRAERTRILLLRVELTSAKPD